MPFLQQGGATQTFPNSATNWWSGVQIPETMRDHSHSNYLHLGFMHSITLRQRSLVLSSTWVWRGNLEISQNAKLPKWALPSTSAQAEPECHLSTEDLHVSFCFIFYFILCIVCECEHATEPVLATPFSSAHLLRKTQGGQNITSCVLLLSTCLISKSLCFTVTSHLYVIFIVTFWATHRWMWCYGLSSRCHQNPSYTTPRRGVLGVVEFIL